MFNFRSHASGSAGNMYTLTDGKTTIIIEAGINIRDIQKALNFKMSQVDGLLLSHSHGDHSKSIKEMLRMSIDCYMPSQTADELKLDHHRVKRVKEQEVFRIGTLRILPFEAQHDVTTYGYLIMSDAGKKFLFITDSYYCKYKFKGLNYIAVECNYSLEILNENIASGRVHPAMKKRLLQSHFSLENVIEFLKANDLSKVEEIHLLHLSDTNSDEKLFKEKVQEATGKRVFIA